jgi:hypothetical protein
MSVNSIIIIVNMTLSSSFKKLILEFFNFYYLVFLITLSSFYLIIKIIYKYQSKHFQNITN